jgi:type 1 fimbria pilin
LKLRNSFHCVPLLACLALPAFAQSSGDVSVTGTLVPGPCSIALGSGGVGDFGTIDTSTLLDVGMKTLPTEPTISLNVTCTAPRLISMTVHDNQMGTVATALQSVAEWFGFGLTSTGQPIGGWRIMTEDAMLNGAPVDTLESVDGVTWTTADWGWHMDNHAGAPQKFRAWGATAPQAVSTASWNLDLLAQINGRSELMLTQDTPLEGSAVIQINYL